MAERINKARYWLAVLYPENMVDGWEERVGDILQLPYAYCVHDADHNIDGEDRKTHAHFIVVHPNTTTYRHALEVFRLLGEKAVNKCEAAINIRHAYDYLIHDTETARKQGKHLYEKSRRVEGNHFDIGAYEQLGAAEKQDMLKELVGFIIGEGFTNINDFTVAAMGQFGDEYWQVIVAYNRMLDAYCAGNYKKEKRARELAEANEEGGSR